MYVSPPVKQDQQRLRLAVSQFFKTSLDVFLSCFCDCFLCQEQLFSFFITAVCLKVALQRFYTRKSLMS